MHYFLLVLVTNIMLQIYVVNMLLSACLIICSIYCLGALKVQLNIWMFPFCCMSNKCSQYALMHLANVLD